MADKIKPLKIENSALGGTQNDPFPTEANPSQDYVAAKGVAFENSDTRLIDLNGAGNIQFTDASETTPKTVRQLRTANQNIFDNTTNGFVSTNVQAAIEESYNLAINSAKAYVFCSYNGNAITGRYLELFKNLPMNTAPLYSSNGFKVLTIVTGSSASSTCTIGFYNQAASMPGTLLYTVTFSSQTRVINTGSIAVPLFTLAANGQLAVKINSGSINNPYLYFVLQG